MAAYAEPRSHVQLEVPAWRDGVVELTRVEVQQASSAFVCIYLDNDSLFLRRSHLSDEKKLFVQPKTIEDVVSDHLRSAHHGAFESNFILLSDDRLAEIFLALNTRVLKQVACVIMLCRMPPKSAVCNGARGISMHFADSFLAVIEGGQVGSESQLRSLMDDCIMAAASRRDEDPAYSRSLMHGARSAAVERAPPGDAVFFDALADELVLCVLAYLTPKTLARMAMTCTRMRRLVGDQGLWRNVVVDASMTVFGLLSIMRTGLGVGASVRRLTLSRMPSMSGALLVLIPTLCPALQHVSLAPCVPEELANSAKLLVWLGKALPSLHSAGVRGWQVPQTALPYECRARWETSSTVRQGDFILANVSGFVLRVSRASPRAVHGHGRVVIEGDFCVFSGKVQTGGFADGSSGITCYELDCEPYEVVSLARGPNGALLVRHCATGRLRGDCILGPLARNEIERALVKSTTGPVRVHVYSYMNDVYAVAGVA